MAYSLGNRRLSYLPKRLVWIILWLVALSFISLMVARHVYYLELRPLNTNQQAQIFTVETGSSVKLIGSNLEKQHLIRSAWAFQLYVHSKVLGSKVQAGTYALSSSQSTSSIVNTLTNGKVATRLVTILPGRRIDQVRADLINAGFSPTSVEVALNPARYSDLPVLAYKPANINSLEGLLWPDSYQKEPDTDPALIIRQSLVAMGEHLTPDIQAAFATESLTTYQGITLASIVVQEVNKPADQAQAAQVFLTRLKAGMMLGSDVTARYGSIIANRSPNLAYDSPYNTLIHSGLPPSPISTINSSSLAAASHPSATNWLFFVTGDDGTTYFSTNLQDHQTLSQKYCHKLCGR